DAGPRAGRPAGADARIPPPAAPLGPTVWLRVPRRSRRLPRLEQPAGRRPAAGALGPAPSDAGPGARPDRRLGRRLGVLRCGALPAATPRSALPRVLRGVPAGPDRGTGGADSGRS